jgi:hypothetical protein
MNDVLNHSKSVKAGSRPRKGLFDFAVLLAFSGLVVWALLL